MRKYSPPSWNGAQTPQKMRCHQQHDQCPKPRKVKTGTRPHAAYEVPLLTATASRVIDMEDTVMASGSLGIPSTIENLEKEVAAMGPVVNKRCRKRGNKGAGANAPPKVLRKDYAASCPAQSTHGEKSIVLIGLDAGSTFSMSITQDAPTAAKSVSDPDLLSYAKSQPHPESFRETATEVPTGHVATTEMQGGISADKLCPTANL
nr:hypothetical protein [Tanacetum cinerariifolium]